MSSDIELLVLDAQGVTFNAPVRKFLKKIAVSIGMDEEFILSKWHSELRELAWLGKIDDEELVKNLTQGKLTHHEFINLFELEFTAGPISSELPKLADQFPIWMLSNHRSHWLRERLKRFGYEKYFDKILVSEEIGSIKPDPVCFIQVLRSNICSNKILYIDDQIKNVVAAKKMGFQTYLLKNGKDSSKVLQLIENK